MEIRYAVHNARKTLIYNHYASSIPPRLSGVLRRTITANPLWMDMTPLPPFLILNDSFQRL